MSRQTLLARLGGDATIERICDALYARVLLDDRIVDFFAGMDVNELAGRQRKFLSCLLDDDKLTDLGALSRVHRPLVEEKGLRTEHFDVMKSLLDEAMIDAGVDALIRNQVLNRMETTRDHVIGKPPHTHEGGTTMTAKLLSLLYGGVAYAIGMTSLAWIGLWLINLAVPNALDAQLAGAPSFAILTNLALVALFAVQHSGMARPAFKRVLTRLVPAHLERSTYVLVSGIATLAVCYFWQPLGGVVWQVENTFGLAAIYSLYTAGWGLLVLSTFWINHFDLFGLRQVWLYARGIRYTHVPFKTPGLYRFIRHPLYLGWFTVMWAAPTMTISHLVFAVLASIYILTAIQWEEADLVEALPQYRRYKARTPMLIPGLSRRTSGESHDDLSRQAA